MLQVLKFVQGAVGKKDFLPALSHFIIRDNYIQSYNGTLSLCSPIKIDLNCIPKAEPFIKAIQNCNETVSLSLTDAGRLCVISGKFKAFIECLDNDTALPHGSPQGKIFDIDGEDLLRAIKHIAPIVGDDASRPWCMGALLKNGCLHATNNVVAIQHWTKLNEEILINIPKPAIKEIIRIGEAPIQLQYNDHSLTLHYADGRWIQSCTLENNWPDFNKFFGECNCEPLNPELFIALDAIKPFADSFGRVYLTEGTCSTTLIASDGAFYDTNDEKLKGTYQIQMLSLLKGIATHIDFTCSPAIFEGENCRGVIMGMRV